MALGFYIKENGQVDLGDNSGESTRLILNVNFGELRSRPLLAGNINRVQGAEGEVVRLVDVEEVFLSDGANSADVVYSPSLVDADEMVAEAEVRYP